MKIKELLNALSQVKKKYPYFDLNEFTVMIDDKLPLTLNVDIQEFVIKLGTTNPEEESQDEVESASDI